MATRRDFLKVAAATCLAGQLPLEAPAVALRWFCIDDDGDDLLYVAAETADEAFRLYVNEVCGQIETAPIATSQAKYAALARSQMLESLEDGFLTVEEMAPGSRIPYQNFDDERGRYFADELLLEPVANKGIYLALSRHG